MKAGLLCLAVLASGVYGEYFVYPEVFNEPFRDKFVFGDFPDGFQWGLATASYQIEGAWNVGGRSRSIWDVWSQTPGNTHDNQTGDDAAKSYYKWNWDVNNLKTMGVDFYRFSIAWPRIIPNGKLNPDGSGVNMEGIKFYNDSINMLVEAGIEPYVTLFHWDLPQTLQDDNGGQTNPEFPEWFSQYAKVCFEYFGDRVKHWITFNEPQTVAGCYNSGTCAPGVYTPGVGGYLVIHHQLLGHALAYKIYNEQYRESQKGEVGITIVANYAQPADDQVGNLRAAETNNQFVIGWLLSPMLGYNNNYPEIMINKIGIASDAQGYNQSRLPVFTSDEQAMLLNATDFVGLNYYTSGIASWIPFVPSPTPDYYNDQGTGWEIPADWPKSNCSWLNVAPFGMRNMLSWTQGNYGRFNTPWYITENGYCAKPTEPRDEPCRDAYDPDKTRYLISHINQCYRAIVEDNVPLKGYTHWSLMDNFEWDDGYSKNFGLYCTNMQDPSRWRTPRFSAMTYHDIVMENGFTRDNFGEKMIEYGLVSEE